MWRALGESIAASELRVDVECAPNLRRGPSGSGNLVSDVHAQALMSAVTHRNARSRPSNQCIGQGGVGLRRADVHGPTSEVDEGELPAGSDATVNSPAYGRSHI